MLAPDPPGIPGGVVAKLGSGETEDPNAGQETGAAEVEMGRLSGLSAGGVTGGDVRPPSLRRAAGGFNRNWTIYKIPSPRFIASASRRNSYSIVIGAFIAHHSDMTINRKREFVLIRAEKRGWIARALFPNGASFPWA
jgi:hypothetical protein